MIDASEKIPWTLDEISVCIRMRWEIKSVQLQYEPEQCVPACGTIVKSHIATSQIAQLCMQHSWR